MFRFASGDRASARTTTVACAAALHALGEATISELASATGLSRPTVRDRLAELPHLVEVISGAEHGESPTPVGGRPASRFRFGGRHGFVIGAEIGKHDERILVCDVAGRLLHIGRHHDPEPRSGRERVRAFRERLDRLVNSLKTTHGRWLGLGVALTGGVGPDGRISYAPHYPDLQGLSPAEAGLAFGDVPLIVEHDLNAAAIAEHAYGAARGADTFALALAWHEVAAGVVVEGRIQRGSRNLAGELNLIDDGPAAPAHWGDVDSFLPVVEAADRGDPAARHDLDAFAARAARQIAYLTLAVDPELVVLGGPLAHRRALTDRIATRLHTLMRKAYPVKLAVTENPTFGPALGSLQLSLTHAFHTLLGDPAFPARIDVRPLQPGAYDAGRENHRASTAAG
ncbi:ROK family transcriptional regulator [Streptomyces sp. NRRL F-5727]|uniref:ROK family transcriptional regulator n=1 Tax=Streptomyces sp. NRRL F-5727 TaxID=1463871 RepID=UPI00099D1E76|nr:ROK family transcriptional regulator [Streptomyces sp. NRRL F-5727]